MSLSSTNSLLLIGLDDYFRRHLKDRVLLEAILKYEVFLFIPLLRSSFVLILWFYQQYLISDRATIRTPMREGNHNFISKYSKLPLVRVWKNLKTSVAASWWKPIHIFPSKSTIFKRRTSPTSSTSTNSIQLDQGLLQE